MPLPPPWHLCPRFSYRQACLPKTHISSCLPLYSEASSYTHTYTQHDVQTPQFCLTWSPTLPSPRPMPRFFKNSKHPPHILQPHQRAENFAQHTLCPLCVCQHAVPLSERPRPPPIATYRSPSHPLRTKDAIPHVTRNQALSSPSHLPRGR